MGLLRWLSDEGSIYSAGDRVQSPRKEDPLEKQWQPMTVFLTGKSHGQRSLAGSSPCGCKRVRHDLATKQPEFISALKLSLQYATLSLPSSACQFHTSPSSYKRCCRGQRFPQWTHLLDFLNALFELILGEDLRPQRLLLCNPLLPSSGESLSLQLALKSGPICHL